MSQEGEAYTKWVSKGLALWRGVWGAGPPAAGGTKKHEPKVLLHLGGAAFQLPALLVARALGCKILVVDARADVPGRYLADEFAQVSTTDREGVLAFARERRVDAVMTYASDVSAPTVAWLAEQLGLVGHPLRSAELLQRKDLTRQLQVSLGLPVPDFRVLRSLEEAELAFRQLSDRVIIKPVDSSGTRGHSVVTDRSDLGEAFERAMWESRCGVLVMEDFLESDCLELDGDIFIQGGQLAFRHYGHNSFPREALAAVPHGEIFPGFYGDDVCQQLDWQFGKIISALGLTCGCLNFDALLSGGQVYLLDIGLRNGGNFVPEMIELSTGFNLTEAAVRAALGESCEVPEGLGSEPVASYLLHSRFEGRFGGVELSDAVKPYVVEQRVFCDEGDPVYPFTQGNHAFGALLMRFPTPECLQDIMQNIEDLVTIRVNP